MSKYKDDISRIKKAQKRAQEMLHNTLTLAERFYSYTSEVLKRLETVAKNEHFPSYFRRWLRAYYGVLDEILLIINGELHRDYYLVEYDEYIHDRTGHSVRYAAGLRLASCSVDGIDYMYSRISKQYGNSKTLEQISLPHDAFCDEVNALSKRFIANGRDFVDNLAKVGYRVFERNFDVRKEHIHIELTINKETTVCKEDNRSLRKVTNRDVALAMVVKDPPAIKALIRNQVAKPSSSRKAFDFDDSDDENIEPSSSAIGIDGEDERTSFEMEAVSLDQIKQNYGASNELLAIPSERIDVQAELGNVYYNNGDEMDVVDYNNEDQNLDNGVEHYAQIDMAWSDEVPSRVQSSMKFKVISPETENASTTAISFVPLEIGMSAFDAIADASDVSAIIIIENICDELIRYLWMGYTPCASPQQPQQQSHHRWQRSPFIPWLPSTIKIQNIRYSFTTVDQNSMDDVGLPRREDLKTKRFPVDCDSSLVVIGLMKVLQEWINEADRSQQQLFRQQLLVSNYKVVYHYAAYLKQLQDGMTDLLLLYKAILPINDEDLDALMIVDEAVLDIEEEAIIQLESLLLSQFQPFTRQIQIISTGPGTLKLRTWWLMMQHFHRVDCSFACFDSLQTVSILSLPDSTPLQVEELIWQNSPLTSYASVQCSEEYASRQEYLTKVDCWDKLMVASFVEDSFPWALAVDTALNALTQHKIRDPWADLCRKLFSHASHLRRLDVSHSCKPTVPLDALVLVIGIIHGLKEVHHCISIQLHGLQVVYPGLDMVLREFLVNGNGSSECTIAIDTNGMRRSGLPF